MALFIGVLWGTKFLLKDAYYKYAQGVLNLVFLAVVYPQPYHFLLLIMFAYAVTYLLSDVIKIKSKLAGIIILLLPMLLVKFDIRFHFHPYELNNIISFAGLSYASFRIVGYYMDKAPGEKITDFVTYFNFLSFTPTLLIGPIEKHSRFKASQSTGFSNMNSGNTIIGINAFVKGLAFKYVLAEAVDRYWMGQFSHESTVPADMAANMYAYYFYLFFDFAGYSFMALGIGKLMGMNVPVNFSNPFLSANPQDFWRRFHISLGDWLKEYFFTPLYMFFSRKKSLKKYPLTRQNIALLLTFVLMGCWNGFKFNYILSGFLFGLYSVIHNTYVVECKKKGRDVVFGNMDPRIIKIISIFIMFNLVAIALYVFSGRCPLI
ncbi:MAG TPA: MBOAT family O-acyltransferase [Bacteroidia bacterium]|jgi:membrane protein involved in D-alanine export